MSVIKEMESSIDKIVPLIIILLYSEAVLQREKDEL